MHIQLSQKPAEPHVRTNNNIHADLKEMWYWASHFALLCAVIHLIFSI
jgi:hypothetical protein